MEQQVHFRNHMGETLAGTLHLPEKEAIGAVIAGHCFTCSRHTGILRRVCNDLCEASFQSLRFDFSGNGQSQGQFENATWSKHILEMKAAVTFLQEKGATWIGLTGHSLGAAVALLTAATSRDVSAVCRIAGRVSAHPLHAFLTSTQEQTLAETGRVAFVSRGRNLTLTRAYFEDAAHYDLLSATRSLAVPMLVVHGDSDDLIPLSEAQLTKATNPDGVELHIVRGGDHMFSRANHQREIGRVVTAWFRRQVGHADADRPTIE